MSNLSDILTELDNEIGLQERNRLGTQERKAAINQAVPIIYGLLEGSPILQRNLTVDVDSDNVATPPSDFNEGIVRFMGDASTWDDSDEVFELNQAEFGRVTSNDIDYFVQNLDDDGNEQFEYNAISSTTCYIEYEKGPPVLNANDDSDGLPTRAKYPIAKVAAGILNSNLLADEKKMMIFLYGPNGDMSRYTPESIMGQLAALSRTRRASSRKTRQNQVNVNYGRKKLRPQGVYKSLFRFSRSKPSGPFSHHQGISG